jgi:hypothetical protein
LSRFCNNFIIQIAVFTDFYEPQNMPFEQRAPYILEQHLSVEESLRPGNAAVERRAKPRANEALPASVWGVAATKGTVIRDNAESDGHTGVAIRIVEHQFILAT